MGRSGAVDELRNALVAEADDRGDGAVAHAGFVRFADGGVSPLTRLGVRLDGGAESAFVIGHTPSLENLTPDRKASIKLDMATMANTPTLIDTVIEAARNLDNNEALFLPSECVIARSNTGKLRFGDGNIETHWRNGDGEELLREHIEATLDARQSGYFAVQYKRAYRDPATLRPVPVVDVGRRAFSVNRGAMALHAAQQRYLTAPDETAEHRARELRRTPGGQCHCGALNTGTPHLWHAQNCSHYGSD